MQRKNSDLSIVLLSYNTKDLLRNCLSSVFKLESEAVFEVIVVDNASTDGSSEMIKHDFPEVILIKNEKNLGFAAGNNKVRSVCRGEYILFLNPDTLIKPQTIKKTLIFIKSNKTCAVVTCKTLLPSGKLDKDARRSFITPWIGLTHLVFQLDKFFPTSSVFARYWYGYLPETRTHEIDVAQGAYFLVRKNVLDEVGWFDEDYFLDGEDIDLCWRIRAAGWRIYYFADAQIVHFKGSAKGKLGSGRNNLVSLSERLKFRLSGVDSMKTFYQKRLWEKYPLGLNLLVIFGIDLVKSIRVIKTLLFG